MGWDAPWHWIVLALIVVVLFGYKKLPDASHSLGKSLRIFRSEMKNDDNAKPAVAAVPVPVAAPVAPVAAPVAPAPAAPVAVPVTAPAPTPTPVAVADQPTN